MADQLDNEATRLTEARQVVKQQAFQMKRALDQKNLREGLKFAALMLGELVPQKSARRMLDMYELVQHAGNVLPRLYLLLTVGSVYIVSKEAPAKDILKDLVEMCRGVQHPMRGLFLRNYLSQMTKSKLPDEGSDYEGVGGNTEDAVSFVLSNFSEMNKLWVRMQHQGPVREREAREKERQELRILVGTNLMQLGKLDGVTVDVYTETVLPQVLEQIVNCKDPIAQQYLMECILQVFPVEYHVSTLQLLLDHLEYLSAAANVKALLVGMMERLNTYSATEDETGGSSKELEEDGDKLEEAPHSSNPFVLFSEHISSLAAPKSDEAAEHVPMSLIDQLELHLALLAFSVKVYPNQMAYVDEVLYSAAKAISAAGTLDGKATGLVLKLVTTPLAHLSEALRVLTLEQWSPLIAHLSHDKQKEVASNLVTLVIDQEGIVSRAADAAKLLQLVGPLLAEDPDAKVDENDARPEPMDIDTAAEVGPVSRLIHRFTADDTDGHCRILNEAHKQGAAGSERRSPFAFVPIIFSCLSLTRRIHGRVLAEEEVEVGTHKLLKFVATMVARLSQLAPTLAFRLYLQCAQVALSVGEEIDAYEFITEAFVCYEEEISDSRDQLAAVTIAASSLHHMHGFDEEHVETICIKATQYSGRLLKKPDQCRAVCRASYMFWGSVGETPYRDGKRVLECLQRSLKIADACKVSNMHTVLFVDILDSYLYHFSQGNELVTADYINSLLQLIEQQLAGDAAAATPAIQAARTQFESTRLRIASQKESDPRWAEIS
eukprot:CAMPEP_0181228236 /NCGR_PEP_ID=MMETSP1096-20121128/33242_1 /TAXON_ID=156174 ORGANISM="Chrysochromulina ericina, Strain CCMP281" /NCGR_SAMPLE_ID=MMETSP1096 /ASSEMBLY_ACC=CAM_ASM_000453 /LENGTH=775 /DNA_ID=CAMNT_0023321751 /DNA_START=31 /DNA_END=2359 /DNA_ORIENTATION=-